MEHKKNKLESITPIPQVEQDAIANLVARNMTKLRLELGYTQAQIATALGIGHVTYGDYERVRTSIPAYIVYVLAEFYNIPVSRFYADVDSKGELRNKEVLHWMPDNPLERIAKGVDRLSLDAFNSMTAKITALTEKVTGLEKTVQSIIGNN